MASPTHSQRALKLKTALGDEVLLIEKIFGEEALGQPFQYTVTAVAETDDFSFDDLLGTVATAELDQKQEAGTPRFFHGVVSQIIHVGYSAQGHSRYELLLVPWLDLARRSSECKIFQQQTVPEILEVIFGKYSGTYDLKLNETYPTRDYCVQYRETDFNFVQRLMEHEGIYYYWEHTEGGYKMILCDSMSTHEPVGGFEEVLYRAHDSGVQEDNIISNWSVRHVVTPGVYVMNSFNFESPQPSPNTKLISRDDKPHPHAQGEWEVYDNPVDYGELSDGERLARIRREEAQVDTKSVVVQTNARGLFPGSVFTPKEVPRKDQSDVKYLITAHSFSAAAGLFGSGSGSAEETYQATLSAIPVEDSVYRSRRVAVKPTVSGVQTALVTGPSGEEVFVDALGRVKVQFHWDREGAYDDGTSCWIRVSQAWAGSGFGGMAIPRIGHEVIVDFVEGNPDYPIIIGRVYNGENNPNASNAGRDGKPGNTPPADLTKAAMMTSFKSNSLGGSGGCNEITMNDAGGAEGLFFKAQKDEIHIVGNDREDTVGNDETISIGNDRNESVGNNEGIEIGNDRTEEVGNDESITIGQNQEIKIGSDRTLDIVGDDTTTIGGDEKKTVSGDEINSIGGDLKETIGGDVIMELGGDHIVKTGGDNKITVTGDRDISVTGKISESSMQEISLSAPMKITLACGPSKIELTPAGITLQTAGLITVQGTMIKLN